MRNLIVRSISILFFSEKLHLPELFLVEFGNSKTVEFFEDLDGFGEFCKQNEQPDSLLRTMFFWLKQNLENKLGRKLLHKSTNPHVQRTAAMVFFMF